MSAADPGLQSDGPNPLELFFEKNKKWIYALAIALVATLAVKYGMEKLERAKWNQQWRDFTAATGLSEVFGETVSLQQFGEQFAKYQGRIWANQLMEKQGELISTLMDDIRNADMAKIEEQIAACGGDARLPWLIWVAANKHYAERDWEKCLSRCQELKQKFPMHLLTASFPHPVQVRKDKVDPDKKKKDKKGKDSSRSDKDKPELEPAVAGSAVDNLIAAVNRDREFEKTNSHFFTPKDPDKGETVVLTLSGLVLNENVEIEIGFFNEAAPKHVAAFKKAVADGYFKDMRIHKIKRKPKQESFVRGGIVPTTIHLGHPNSKNDDRSTWKVDVPAKDEEILDFEVGTQLSFFPFTVAAEQEKDGKSSGRRFFICQNDCAASFDGDYVIFGRVIRGMEHVTKIATESDMSDIAEDNAGEGRPVDDFKVVNAEVRKG